MIPFHLQIRGSPASLIPFLELSYGATGHRNKGIIIRVYLLRQTSVIIHGQHATACRHLGEGKLEASPSSPSGHHTFLRHPLGENLDSLDWDGVLRCVEDVTVPSFSSDQFSVKVGSSSRFWIYHIFLPSLDTGFYRSVDRSSATTQVTTARCNALLSNPTRDRSLVKWCWDSTCVCIA